MSPLKKAFASGVGFGIVLITACAASPNWKEPPSWTLRPDNRLRASQRNEDFSFDQWKAKYLAREGKDFGVVLTPAGVAEVAKELSRRNAEIIRLQNYISNGCR